MPTLCRRSSHLDSDTQEESSSLDRKILNQALTSLEECPLDCRIFNVVTDLFSTVRKLDTSCDVIRSISYATINELYPEPE
ncbi:hypothetical protein CEXT_357501 [Caerostris extrusa]|uniref:Uncharacterized protein n=1 Tax=Caerostris extrusa TaxID=172846 RepID=A0AAV4U4D0_CAEEX|nr:hypothetical protein CEXT_357501 [Caerostris extrusa]